VTLDERFAQRVLDETTWFPYYLPHWSSRRQSRAVFEVLPGLLRLTIPNDHPLWCPDTHIEPLRVSGIQSGNVPGSQAFRDDLEIVELDNDFRGHIPMYGQIGIRMRGEVSERSMFAFWLSGIEDTSERSGEICVAEIFGAGVTAETARVGIGVRAIRDPKLVGDFTEDAQPIDVARFHDFAVDWMPGWVSFTIDGAIVKEIDESPDYPVILMIGLFDFPARATSSPLHTPVMEVERVWSRPLD
jgi:hypothetical protein